MQTGGVKIAQQRVERKWHLTRGMRTIHADRDTPPFSFFTDAVDRENDGCGRCYVANHQQSRAMRGLAENSVDNLLVRLDGQG